MRVSHPHVGIFSTVDALMRGDSTSTGFFTNASLYDAKYELIEYKTAQGAVLVPNSGTGDVLICRYDTATLIPTWVQTAGGRGEDGGGNYFVDGNNGSVYVTGYFQDTAYFPITPGSSRCDTVISQGNGDMFIAKYRYDNGALQWVRSGGSKNSDVVFMYGGSRHSETFMLVDSVSVTICTNFFGPATFSDHSIDAKPTGSAVAIRYNKKDGSVLSVRFVTDMAELRER